MLDCHCLIFVDVVRRDLAPRGLVDRVDGRRDQPAESFVARQSGYAVSRRYSPFPHPCEKYFPPPSGQVLRLACVVTQFELMSIGDT